MRVKIRQVVDPSRVPDISKLDPIPSLVVAFKQWYRQSNRYARKMEKELTKENKIRIQKEELLKEELITVIVKTLDEGENNSDNSLDSIILSINREAEKELRSILSHKDFVAYNITILDCDRDMLRSFPTIPLRIQVRTKVLRGDKQ